MTAERELLLALVKALRELHRRDELADARASYEALKGDLELLSPGRQS